MSDFDLSGNVGYSPDQPVGSDAFQGPVSMSRAEFTPQVQEQIINNSFNGTPSSGLYAQKMSERMSEGLSGYRQALQQKEAELNSYRQQTAQLQYQMNERAAQPQTAQQTYKSQQQEYMELPPAEETNENDVLANLFGEQKAKEEEQPIEEERAQPQNREIEQMRQLQNEFINGVQRASASANVDPSEAMKFMQELSPEDFVAIYKGYKSAVENQTRQQQPQRLPNLAEISGVRREAAAPNQSFRFPTPSKHVFQ